MSYVCIIKSETWISRRQFKTMYTSTKGGSLTQCLKTVRLMIKVQGMDFCYLPSDNSRKCLNDKGLIKSSR